MARKLGSIRYGKFQPNCQLASLNGLLAIFGGNAGYDPVFLSRQKGD